MMSQPTRFVVVNGRQLRIERKARGWTQRELAKAAGYSERTIRKAEKGGQLDLETVENLAEALGVPVKKLKINIAAIARQWVEAYETLERRMLPAIEAYLAPDFEFVCPGDPATAPFIGTWKGKEGMQQWLDLFFGFFQRDRNTNTEYLEGDNIVVAHWLESGKFQGIPCGPIRINMHFRFRDGLIVRIEDDYDTGAGEKHVNEAKKRLKTRPD